MESEHGEGRNLAATWKAICSTEYRYLAVGESFRSGYHEVRNEPPECEQPRRMSYDWLKTSS
ncbi:hypothetical protein K443DRAFT_255223 [Laccaria amethystina LaAM-08-1]|uniref:Unplaced genomic scaffold K443scaffold_162, whole genome shotgun sequence n=1 Tax=Laccaria amethystina LaAM-08-1 TaxID=1095629 RepID=A0A0C9X7E3_9AGAR|nr:hypothetical protein K443DRAFT_255223 [Laccaria amethystina LaAM-08-1]